MKRGYLISYIFTGLHVLGLYVWHIERVELVSTAGRGEAGEPAAPSTSSILEDFKIFNPRRSNLSRLAGMVLS